MTDQVLDVLKLVLLALLYLFFARVLWAVWSEVRQPANVRHAGDVAPAPTPAGGVPAPAGRRTPKPAKGRRGTPARLVTLEPKERRGTAFALGATVTIGREPDNTIVITDDAYISSHHATISMADGHVVVDDLGSRNGTYLNGAKLTQRHTVHTGDRIQIGYTVLEAQ
jgi:pSer/pThr/pTyr-binding forkhead associated (FHA) protein